MSTLVGGVFAPSARAQDVDGYAEPDAASAPPAGAMLSGSRPGDAIVVTGEELERQGWHTLSDFLASVPGLDVRPSTLGRRHGGRGLPDGISVVVDGVPAAPTGGPDLLDLGSGLDLANVERVEVIRGPVSAVDGAGALAGVVRVTTRRPGLTGARVRAGLATGGGVDLGGEGTVRSGDLAARLVARYRHERAGD